MAIKVRVLLWTLVILVVVVISPAIYFVGNILLGFYWLRKDLDAREHELRYKTDYTDIAPELRAFASSVRWAKNGANPTYRPNDSDFPAAARSLHATSIAVYADEIEVECGGTWEHFGIRVFKDGETGYGNAKLGEGLWFYVTP